MPVGPVGGHNLGLRGVAALEWTGRRGMLWDEFFELVSQGTPDVPPDILEIHLGCNDLAKRLGKSLILQVIADLRAPVAQCPKMHIIW